MGLYTEFSINIGSHRGEYACLVGQKDVTYISQDIFLTKLPYKTFLALCNDFWLLFIRIYLHSKPKYILSTLPHENVL